MRQSNYEMLRFVSTILIILLHVAAGSIDMTMSNPGVGFTVSNAFDSVTRYAVPLFVMLSGAFQLKNPKNQRIGRYYPKIIKNILIPTLIWSVVYVVYQIVYGLFLCAIGYRIYDDAIFNYPLMQFLKGSPFYHMWYLYMALGLFFVTPFLISAFKNCKQSSILFTGIIFTLFGFAITEAVTLIWPLKFIQYLGYYIMGYWINENKYRLLKWKKHFLLLACISTLLIFYFTELLVTLRPDFFKPLYFYGFLSPFVILGSMFLFAFTACSSFSGKWILKVSQYSFTMYLCHALILDILTNLLSYLDFDMGAIMRIPLLTIPIFIISFYLAVILKNISSSFRFVNKKPS